MRPAGQRELVPSGAAHVLTWPQCSQTGAEDKAKHFYKNK